MSKLLLSGRGNEMIETYTQIKNLYKKRQVFRCVHDAHRHFKSELSPFYVLAEKNCYPDGCVYFQWQCRLLAKQKTCFRGFSYVGKKCFNCRHFFEEKQHQYPEFKTNGESVNAFLDAFEDFEEWVDDLKTRHVPCEGRVAGVVPELYLKPNGPRDQLNMNGFLVRFDQGYLDNHLFEDAFYLSLSAMSQNQLQLREGDSVEFEARLNIDRGRFKFSASRKFQFFERGPGKALRTSDIQVALKTYTLQNKQPDKCLSCNHGILVDKGGSAAGPSRKVVCLEGVNDYRDCTISFMRPDGNNQDTCVNTQWGENRCHHVL
ncbi:MAG: hypothetical protein E4H13_04685 [Calditrichales bacterium]|nr:MAG: hypothetical protein E4H13_04685 [Calditrichales bacterium]